MFIYFLFNDCKVIYYPEYYDTNCQWLISRDVAIFEMDCPYTWKNLLEPIINVTAMDLDETDVNILKVLQVNGRLSFRQISERVKVSVPTVSSKISNMENMGIVRGYQADLDSERMGELSVVLTIKAKPSELKSVADRFQADEHVRKLFTLSNGRLLMICTFSGSHLINDFVGRLGDIPEIIEYDIANIINVVKEQQRALVEQNAIVVVQCSFCKKEIRDDPFKFKADGRDYYLCCQTCLKSFQEKYDKLKGKT